MSPPSTQRSRFYRSRSSSASLNSDDEDAITPCPINIEEKATHVEVEVQQQQQQNTTSASISSPPLSSSSRRSSSRSLFRGKKSCDPETLWRRMLAVQRRFGCYRSARIDAALEAEAAEEDEVSSRYVPSPMCLDLLNDSLDELSDEERHRIDDFLKHGAHS